jgi:hypothetical protein
MLHQCPAVAKSTQICKDGLWWGGDPSQAALALEDERNDCVHTGFDLKFFVQSTVLERRN